MKNRVDVCLAKTLSLRAGPRVSGKISYGRKLGELLSTAASNEELS